MLDLDEIVFIKSEYRQHHGEGVYANDFADKLIEEFKNHVGMSDRNSVSVGNAIIGFHNNKEVKAKIDRNVRKRHVFYIHEFRGYSGEQDPNIGQMALFEVEDALSGTCRADRITLVLPHIPFLRGDWASESRVPIPAKLYAGLTEKSARGKLDHIITMDMHARQERAFYDNVVPDDLPYRPVIAERFKGIPNIVGAALDGGGAGRARDFSEDLARANGVDYIPTIVVDKRRVEDSEAEVINVLGDPNKKVCVSYEDMIDTGGTAAEGAKALYNLGAKKVYICAPDGIFSPKYKSGMKSDSMETLRESKAMVVISDTIPQPEGFIEKYGEFVEILSVAPIFGRAVYEIATKGSISGLY